ncbi:unnamed protein product [Ectocarpus sp. 13 AM-2016]
MVISGHKNKPLFSQAAGSQKGQVDNCKPSAAAVAAVPQASASGPEPKVPPAASPSGAASGKLNQDNDVSIESSTAAAKGDGTSEVVAAAPTAGMPVSEEKPTRQNVASEESTSAVTTAVEEDPGQETVAAVQGRLSIMVVAANPRLQEVSALPRGAVVKAKLFVEEEEDESCAPETMEEDTTAAVDVAEGDYLAGTSVDAPAAGGKEGSEQQQQQQKDDEQQQHVVLVQEIDAASDTTQSASPAHVVIPEEERQEECGRTNDEPMPSVLPQNERDVAPLLPPQEEDPEASVMPSQPEDEADIAPVPQGCVVVTENARRVVGEPGAAGKLEAAADVELGKERAVAVPGHAGLVVDEETRSFVEGSKYLRFEDDERTVLCTLTDKKLAPDYIGILNYMGSRRVQQLVVEGPVSVSDLGKKGTPGGQTDQWK